MDHCFDSHLAIANTSKTNFTLGIFLQSESQQSRLKNQLDNIFAEKGYYTRKKGAQMTLPKKSDQVRQFVHPK